MTAYGFTGTLKGMTLNQRKTLIALLEALPVSILHHGMAPGADTEAEQICRDLDIETMGHPFEGQQTKCPRPTYLRAEKPDPITRNDDIAKVGLLFAAPRQEFEVQRSGTWTTIRRARKRHHPVIIIWPSGLIRGESNEKAY